ncbi:hypothetical protein B0H19DRAFT_1144128 [Mycena capillaripes]|nr:hypothetical protein B0H19DRAFT_1144128 [Mycena capillaripes]
MRQQAMRRRTLWKQRPSFRLLELPLELRQCIYEYALGGRVIRLELVIYAHPLPQRTGKVPADIIPAALLLTCRQAYIEALLPPDIRSIHIIHLHLNDLTGPAWTVQRCFRYFRKCASIVSW